MSCFGLGKLGLGEFGLGKLVRALAVLASTAPLAWSTVPASTEETVEIAARFAILVEAETGTVLYEKNADALMAPSSMAKLMTAELVFQAVQDGRLRLDQEVTVSNDAWRRGGAPSRSSTMYLEARSRVRVEDLIHGMIIQSGNDASIALAEALKGNEPDFAEAMTQRARALGMARSVFGNATGLPDPQTQVTARELALLARHLIQSYPEFYPIYSQRAFTWNKIRQTNRNPLLTMGIGADGMKTGFTRAAGFGLVGSAMQDRMRLVMVINGLGSEAERAAEARKLLEWGFGRFELQQFSTAGVEVGMARLYGGEKGRVPLLLTEPIRLVIPRGTADAITARIVYEGPVATPVEKGQRIGNLEIAHGGRKMLGIPLEAAESVAQGTVGQRAFDAAAAIILGLLRAGAERI